MLAALLLACSAACNMAPPPQPVSDARPATRPSAARIRGAVLSQNSLQAVSNAVLTKPAGGTFKLADMKGKVILVDFWATYCGPCRAQAPKLAALREKYRSKGLEVVGLNVDDPKDLGLVKEFMSSVKMTYPVGRNREVSDAFLDGTEDDTGAPPIPQLFVFGRNGRLINHFVGYDPKDPQADGQLEKLINQELSTTPASQ